MNHRFLRRISVAVMAIMALISGGSSLKAQSLDTLGTYKVVKNTTLWDLSSKMYGKGEKWTKIFDANIAAGTLDSTKLRYDHAGTPIVILSIGQEILLGRHAAAKASTVVAEVPSPTTLLEPSFVTQVEEKANDSPLFWYGFLGILLVIVAIILFWALMRKLSNPVSSGPPMRPQGVTDESAPDRFREMASAHTGTVGSPNYIPPERIRLLNIRRGRGYGLMRVSYGDGRQETKRLTGEVVYEARVEFPDGRQETMYCLQACANDLVYAGNRYIADRLFRFEADGASIPIPQPEAVVSLGGVQINLGDEDLTITQGGRTITIDADGLRKGPDGGLILTKDGHADVLFQNGRITGAPIKKRAAASKVVAPTAEE